MIVPRTQRSAISAFTRVFDALWHLRGGALRPGPYQAPVFMTVPALRSGMKNAASRPGHGDDVDLQRLALQQARHFAR
jgi:hypothetical protein